MSPENACLLPPIQFFKRKRLKEFFSHDEFPFEDSELPPAFFAADRD